MEVAHDQIATFSDRVFEEENKSFNQNLSERCYILQIICRRVLVTKKEM